MLSAAYGVSTERVLIDALAVGADDRAHLDYCDFEPRTFVEAIAHFRGSMRYPMHELAEGSIEGFRVLYQASREEVIEALTPKKEGEDGSVQA